MGVRIKTWLASAAGFFAIAAVADSAAAQCGGGCQPPPPPPPPCCLPPPPPPPPPGCGPGGCGGGGGGGGGWNSNINVNVNVNAGAHATATSRALINARGGFGSTVIYGGGGGAYFNVDQPYPTSIQGLNVEGMAAQVIRVPFTASRRWEKRMVIQAVCIDDRSVPHPASQVRPGRDVSMDYEGELYRCMAGTRLQLTMAEYLGDINFDQGETLTCAKGEALWHGRGGLIECRPQKRERDCNERSLLRRYGAGVKILTLVREETYTEYREEVVQTAGAVASGAAIMLDGGVGGRVF